MTEKDVLNYIRMKRSISVAELERITPMGFAAARRYLCGLADDGVLESGDGLNFDYIERRGEPAAPAEEYELGRRSEILDKMYEELHTINDAEGIPLDLGSEEAVADCRGEELLSPDDEEDLELDSDGLLETCGDERRVFSAKELAAVGNGITLDAVKSHLSEGFETVERGGECWLSCGAAFPDKSPFKLSVKGLGSGILFSDSGSTLEYLEKKRSLNGLEYEIESILREYGVARLDNELIIKIFDVNKAFRDFLALYSASLRVARIG